MLSFLPLSACEYFKELIGDEVDYYSINFFDSDGTLSQVEIEGYLNLGGTSLPVSSSTFSTLYVSQNYISLSFQFQDDNYTISVPTKNGDYVIVDDYLGENMHFGSAYQEFPEGTGSLSGLTIKAKDSYEGKGRFNISGKGKFTRALGTRQPKSFDFILSVDFDTDRAIGSPISGGNSGGSTGGSTGGGSGSTSCVNDIDAKNLVSYWRDQIVSGYATGTGRKVAGNTIFADYKASDVALVLDGSAGGTRYVVQIMFTGANLVANKTIEFRNAGVGTGLTNTGAVGRLIAFKGTLNDDWRTNRDYGKNMPVGILTIETVTPKITGRYRFEAFGDGYNRTTNLQKVDVSGRFCIDP